MKIISTIGTNLARRIISVSERRSPDFIIGGKDNPYLRRWWIIPRNPVFNIYLHQFRRSDDDRALHDHPWFNLSILLRGSYIECTKKGRFVRHAGEYKFPSPWALHRVELFDRISEHRVAGRRANDNGLGIVALAIKDSWPCWTLFITGPRLRNWGFACPQGFVPWQKFTSHADKGDIGKGCDQ